MRKTREPILAGRRRLGPRGVLVDAAPLLRFVPCWAGRHGRLSAALAGQCLRRLRRRDGTTGAGLLGHLVAAAARGRSAARRLGVVPNRRGGGELRHRDAKRHHQRLDRANVRHENCPRSQPATIIGPIPVWVKRYMQWAVQRNASCPTLRHFSMPIMQSQAHHITHRVKRACCPAAACAAHPCLAARTGAPR